MALFLTGTSDIIRVVTGSAADVDVHTSWVDVTTGPTYTVGRTNTTAITTATTTTIVGSPAASTQRSVRHINITNAHASATTTVTVQHYDGTTSEDLMGVSLLPGENLVFTAEGEWRHHNAAGAEYSYTPAVVANLGRDGTLAETIPRQCCNEANVSMAASGTLNLQLIYLYAGQTVANITISSATTAAGTPTHYWFALYDYSTRNLLASSADQTSTAWAANTVKTLAMSTPYVVPVTGLYYIGYVMVATTVPTIKGQTVTGGQLAMSVPILHGPSSTGITTALPNPAAAISGTGNTASFYAAVT